jgi:hypothetical protein
MLSPLMQTLKHLFNLAAIVLIAIGASACSQNDNSHTTAITYVAPPAQQVLTVVKKPVPASPALVAVDPSADQTKPLLIFHLENEKKFRVGEEVPLEFTVMNAKLKSDGGEFQLRYIIDDDDMKWLDDDEPFWLAGWTPGEHTVRVELIGPNGWPYKNGNANIVTREITVGNGNGVR